MQHSIGFTLVELLVVITIIAILLALLSPALDTAIYRAELAVCGTHEKAVSTGVLTYAMENRRWYPHRPGVHDINAFWLPNSLTQGANNVTYDDRKLLRPFIQINKMLNDPTLPAAEFENTPDGSWVWSSMDLWFGYQFGYQPTDPRKVTYRDKGMFKMGDRLTFSNNGEDPVKRFNVLASDMFYTRSTSIDIASSHPDGDDLLHTVVSQDKESSTENRVDYVDPDRALTYSRWEAFGVSAASGPMDLNYAYDDGSVILINQIEYHETERVDRVGITQRAGSYPVEWRLLAK